MPRFLRTFAEIIPLTPFIEGFRKIYIQGLGIEFIAPYAKQLLISGVIFFAFAYVFTALRIKYAKAEHEIKAS
jgi:ABC-type polysaccharide/polyol phosphate export permease